MIQMTNGSIIRNVPESMEHAFLRSGFHRVTNETPPAETPEATPSVPAPAAPNEVTFVPAADAPAADSEAEEVLPDKPAKRKKAVKNA